MAMSAMPRNTARTMTASVFPWLEDPCIIALTLQVILIRRLSQMQSLQAMQNIMGAAGSLAVQVMSCMAES